MSTQEDKRFQIARQRVEEKKKFYSHLTTYLVMSVFFVLLNLFTSPGRWWFVFPVLGWGIGIAIQYIKAFGPPMLAPGADWEARALQEELRKLGIKEESEAPTAHQQQSTPDLPDDHLSLKELQKRYDEKDLV